MFWGNIFLMLALVRLRSFGLHERGSIIDSIGGGLSFDQSLPEHPLVEVVLVIAKHKSRHD